MILLDQATKKTEKTEQLLEWAQQELQLLSIQSRKEQTELKKEVDVLKSEVLHYQTKTE